MPDTFYYGLLDTVKVDPRRCSLEVREQQTLVAHAEVMWDMLVADVTPVLSQNHIFDQHSLLALVGRFDADADGLLRLMRRGRVQARIHDDAALKAAVQNGAGSPLSVKSAFVGRLAGDFHFSAWPELDDHHVRSAVLRKLTTEPNLTLGHPAVENRLAALVAIDRALDESQALEWTRDVGADLLAIQLRKELDTRPEHDLAKALWSRLETTARGTDGLASRTGILKALDRLVEREQLLPGNAVVDDLRQLVDFHYNRVLAASVRATDAANDYYDPSVSALLNQSVVKPEISDLVSTMLPIDTARAWLRWSEMPARIEAYRHFEAGKRLEAFENERVAFHVGENHWVRAVYLAPTGALAVAGDMAAAAAGGGWVAAGLCGLVASGLTVSPPVQQFMKKYADPIVTKMASRRVRNGIVSRASAARREV